MMKNLIGYLANKLCPRGEWSPLGFTMEKCMNKLLIALSAVLFAFGTSAAYASRDTIRIVGSSTVYPFTTIVAENFGKKSGSPTPIVESTGTGGGIKMFCEGAGEDTPDAVNASRAIKDTELEMCKTNGVTVTEVKIGYDAIVLAMAKEHEEMTLTTNDIYRALAKYVLVDGKFVENTFKTWNDVNSSLPNSNIEVLGPPPTSGTRDSFVELVLEKECKSAIKQAGIEVSPDDEKKYCKSMREDGAFIEAGENDNLIVQKLQANPNALGIFGYSFLEENGSTIKGASINGVVPEYDTIQQGDYSISRPLFVYFKNEHLDVIPGLKEFIEEYKSEEAIGSEGYLTEKGLISLN
jgi:phosphate transport system substrate-binding protein